MKVRDLVEKLMQMDPEMLIFVADGEDQIGPLFAPAELVDTASQVVMTFGDPDRPFYSEPQVTEVVRIRRYW